MPCRPPPAFAAFALLGMLLGAAETTARAAGAEAVLMLRPETGSHRRYGHVNTVYDMYTYIYISIYMLYHIRYEDMSLYNIIYIELVYRFILRIASANLL